jgi:hypothetical protein
MEWFWGEEGDSHLRPGRKDKETLKTEKAPDQIRVFPLKRAGNRRRNKKGESRTVRNHGLNFLAGVKYATPGNRLTDDWQRLDLQCGPENSE